MGLFDPKQRSDNSNLEAKIDALTKGMEDMQKLVGQLSGAVTTLHTNQQNLQESVGTVRANMEHLQQPDRNHYQQAAHEERIRSIGEYSDEELGQLTEQQKFQQLEHSMAARLEKAVEGLLKPMAGQIQDMQKASYQTKTQTELHQLVNEVGEGGKLVRPDFNDLLPGMIEMRKDPVYASLPLRSIYTLAKEQMRASNPEEFSRMQEKYFPKEKNVQIPYGGLMPEILQETAFGGDLSIEDAGQEALRELSENSGGIPAAEGSV